ncbi:MAG TPA: methyltransferase domain-containing protein [Pyrinomonadaceae bacterium]|nr:methyltransferase domain-containing protein [Pyrinomonadaceae bacterium]
MQEPVALAHEAIHETAANILQTAERGKVLDVPAGEGALALRLKNLGFEVFCCDLYTEFFKLPGTEIKPGNLDGRLPYDDRTFDYVVCVEGLEHIENPANAFREFARILKENGTLIVSVPNIMNIEERLKWLFNGYTSHFKPLSGEELADIETKHGAMAKLALHVNPIGYSEVRYLLEKSGFTIEKTYLDKPKKNSWAYFPIVGLIKLAARFTSEKKRKSRWTDELNSDEVLLGGNTLIFKAKKN